MKREQDKRKPKRQEPSMITDPLTICTHILPLRKERTYGRPAGTRKIAAQTPAQNPNTPAEPFLGQQD